MAESQALDGLILIIYTWPYQNAVQEAVKLCSIAMHTFQWPLEAAHQAALSAQPATYAAQPAPTAHKSFGHAAHY